MTEGTTDSPERGSTGSVWEPGRRTEIAGLAGIFGGSGLALLSISRAGLGFDPGPASAVYPFGYVLLAVVLLAGNARYGRSYGDFGNGIALLFVLALSSYAASIVVLVAARTVVDVPTGPFTGLVGIAFFAMRLLATLYGVALWRQTDASRIVAGSFVVVLPSVFVLGPLTLVGFPAFAVEVPLYLAFVGFGYGLWRGDHGR